MPQTQSVEVPDWLPTDLFDWQNRERDCLVLNYTMACPLSCDFCCYGCHPKRTERMPMDLALRLVDEAGEMSNFSCVGFTGGEALLFPEEILRIADRCHENELGFTVATAAHWARSKTDAESLLGELKARGLTRLNISHDPSHAQFVPRENVLNAAEAADASAIPTYIVGTFLDPTMNLATYVPELVGVGHVRLITKLVARVGRAAKADISRERYGITTSLHELACYRQVHHDIVVFWDGKTYPCCSTFNRATKGIVIGNAFEDSLKELWYRAEGSLLFRVIKRQGFGRLYEIVEQYDPALFDSLPSLQTVVGPCSLCNAIFRDPETTERVKEVFARYERDRIGEQLDSLAKGLSEEQMRAITEEMTELVERTAGLEQPSGGETTWPKYQH